MRYIIAICTIGSSLLAVPLYADDHGDDCASATELITDGTPMAGAIEVDGDEDWFRFDVVADHVYEIGLESDTAGFTPIGYLYGEDCEYVWGSVRVDQMLIHQCIDDGERFLRVWRYGGGYVGDYHVRVTDLGALPDDHGNYLQTGTEIPTDGSVVGGVLDYDFDVDFFRFDAVVHGIYEVELHAIAPILSVRARIDNWREQWTGADVTIDWQDGWVPVAVYIHELEGGQWGIRIDRDGEPGTGAYELRVRLLEVLPGDQHGEDCDSATVIATNGTAVRGVLDPYDYQGDQDWLEFYAVEGHHYEFALEFETYVDVFIPPLLVGEDCTTNIGHTDPWFTYVAEASGARYIVFGLEWAYFSGVYNIRVTDVSDLHGDDCTTATELATDGTPMPGSIISDEDQDWFRFEVQAGHFYDIFVDELTYGFSTRGRVYGEDCETVWHYLGDSTYGDRLVHRCGEDGVRFLQIYGYDDDDAGTYFVRVTDLGVLDDDHGNYIETGTLIPTDGSTVEGSLEYDYDVDCLRFDAVPFGIYTVEMRVYPELEEADWLIGTASGMGVWWDRAWWEYGWEGVPVYVPELEGGHWGITVSRFGQPGTGRFQVRVTHVDTLPAGDQHGDDCESATWLAVDGVSVLGAIDPPDDEDWFEFRVTAGHEYEIELEPLTLFEDRCLLKDEDCTTTLREVEGVATYTPDSDGIRYIRVAGGSYYGGRAYGVSVTDLSLPPDDHGDSFAAGTPIPTDGTIVAGEIDYEYDEDYFRFACEPHGLYEVEVRPSAALDWVSLDVLRFDGIPVGGRETFYSAGDFQGLTVYVGGDEAGEWGIRIGNWYQPLVGPYEVRVTHVGSLPGDDAQGDDCDTATPLATDGAPVQGVIDPITDQDYFSISFEAGHRYLIDLDWATCDFQPRAELLAEDCATVLADIGTYPPFEFVSGSDRQRYLRVFDETAGFTGVFSLSVTDLGPIDDDHGDDLDSGTPIPVDGTVVPGRIDYGEDIDFFRFEVASDGVYEVGVRALLSVYAVEVTVYDHEGVFVARRHVYHYDGWDTIRVYTGTHQLGDWGLSVERFGGTDPGDYEVAVTWLGPLVGDVDQDGDVDLSDLAALLASYRKCTGEPDYNPAADFDDSGCVDLSDLAELLSHYGEGT